MPFELAVPYPADSSAVLQVALKQISAHQRHIGLVYLRADGAWCLSHLEWHGRLVNRELDGDYYVHVCALDDLAQSIIAGWLTDLPSLMSNVAYGIDSTGCIFDPSTRAYVPGPIGKGLTCATFVIAVFRTLGFDILDAETWPQRSDDDVWQRQIISFLAGCADAEHVEAVMADVGSRRFRPEEVAAAATTYSGPPPLTFAEVLALSEDIVRVVSGGDVA